MSNILFINFKYQQKKVYNCHQFKNPISLTPPDEKRGTKTLYRIPISVREKASQHISSFPTIASHYCRSDTKRLYLESDLNVSKMYKMYVNLCLLESTPAVGIHVYRDIFNNDFNLSFYTPKKDLCDLCEEYKVLQKVGSKICESKTEKYEEHCLKKSIMRIERDSDSNIDDPKIGVLCFDLENVFALTKCNVGSAFYKRKLTAYNMTGHLTVNSKKTVAIWNAGLVGRSGNDIASAIESILNKVISGNPTIQHIITWSDSCVPQNRNSILSTAIIGWMLRNPSIHTLKMKYSVPGHSCIQVVDNIHSQIENSIKNIDVWSPLFLVKLLLNVNKKNPFNILQLNNQNDFKNFHIISKNLLFSKVPFLKVVELLFEKSNPFIVKFKTLSHGFSDYESVNIFPMDNSNKITLESIKNPPIVRALKNNKLGLAKISDVQSLYKFMPVSDKEFYEAVFAKY